MKALQIIAIFVGLLLFHASPTSGYAISDSYRSSDGSLRYFSYYEGSYLFVDGMATDCSHCQAQHPVLEELYQSHGDQITMLSLTIWARQSLSDMQAFVQTYNTPWNWGSDEDGTYAQNYGITGTPTMILFGPTGLEISRWRGETSITKLRSDINYILNNQIEDSSDLPTSIGQADPPAPSPPSFIEQVFGNTIFQVTAVVILVLFIFVKTTGSKS